MQLFQKTNEDLFLGLFLCIIFSPLVHNAGHISRWARGGLTAKVDQCGLYVVTVVLLSPLHRHVG